ncbi:MAG: hypothetical protein ACLR7D_04390 [Lachnospira eligens]
MNIADYADIPGDDYIVIQTTSVGLHPNDTAVVIDDEAFYKRRQLVLISYIIRERLCL